MRGEKKTAAKSWRDFTAVDWDRVLDERFWDRAEHDPHFQYSKFLIFELFKDLIKEDGNE